MTGAASASSCGSCAGRSTAVIVAMSMAHGGSNMGTTTPARRRSEQIRRRQHRPIVAVEAGCTRADIGERNEGGPEKRQSRAKSCRTRRWRQLCARASLQHSPSGQGALPQKAVRHKGKNGASVAGQRRVPSLAQKTTSMLLRSRAPRFGLTAPPSDRRSYSTPCRTP
jgi:hypothetical protein